MAPKRGAKGAHSGHVAAKKHKRAKDMAHVERQEDQIALKRGISELAETIRNDPNAARKLRRAQDAIKIDDHTMEDKDRFASDLEGRQLKRAPAAFLKKDWMQRLPTVSGMKAPEQLEDQSVRTAIVKKNGKAPLQLVCRLACVSETDPLGPMGKNDWLQVYNDRNLAMGGWPADLNITSDYELDFANGRHFRLVPPMGSDCGDPAQHKYEGFQFLGKNIPFTGPLASSITGAWKPCKNWDHNKAYIEDLLYPKLASEFASFLVQALQEMLPRMTFPIRDAQKELQDSTGDPNILQIEDLREVASPGPKGRDASSMASCATEGGHEDSKCASSSVGGASGSPKATEKSATPTGLSPRGGGATVVVPGIQRPGNMSQKKRAVLKKREASQATKEDVPVVFSDTPGGA